MISGQSFRTLDSWGIFTTERPALIAGPCSAESLEQVLETADGLKKRGINVFRAGLWKPRTRPGNFEGVGAKGLEWLKLIKSELGMKVCTEVAHPSHVEQCIKAGIDMLWVGARTSASPFLVQEIADSLSGCDIPVLVKNPTSPDLPLWIGALERFERAGIGKLGVIYRGFLSEEETRYRNSPQWHIAIELRSLFPELPFFCDPSHLGGKREYIGELCLRAVSLGLDGLMIESHCNPGSALSDSMQQLTPEELGEILSKLQERSNSLSESHGIEPLRSEIDTLDSQILATLAQRMKISREIGKIKKKNGIPIIQTGRWEEILSGAILEGKSLGLDEDFIRRLFNVIHDESVRGQD